MKEIIYTFAKSRARNAQHLQFVADVMAAVPETTATEQGFATQRTAFVEAATAEVDCFRPDKGYLNTPDIEDADRKRDNIFLLYKQIAQAYADYCPDEEQRKAGKTVAFAFHEAGDATRLDYASETAVLADLAGKLTDVTYAQPLEVIGIGNAATEILEANDAFNAVYLERSAQERDRALGTTMKELRPVSDAAFEELAKAINALYAVNELVTKDEAKRTALEKVIDDVNTVVVRFRKTISRAPAAEDEPEPAG